MRRHRPASVLVIAILHLVGGGLGLFCNLCSGVNHATERVFMTKAPPAGISGQDRFGWSVRQRAWKEVPAYPVFLVAHISFSLLLAVMLIVLGVGLLYMQRWAWFGSLGYCLLSLIHKAFLAFYVLVLFIPTANDIIGEEAARLPPQALPPGFTAGFKFTYFGIPLFPLLFAVYPVVVLFVLLRPAVIEAFRSRGRPARRREYDDLWDPEDF